MEMPATRIAELERANYAATLPSADVTPGLDVLLREDVVLTWSTAFPTPDSNHACLLRAAAGEADDLIDEITGFFRSRDLPVAVYLSEACIPNDLPRRLTARGFHKQPGGESWMVLENLAQFQLPPTHPGITVRPISSSETLTFAEVFLGAFGLPGQFAPVLARLLRPSVPLAGTQHYLAFAQDQPIGTCSLLRHGHYGILGSTGVLSEHRGGGGAINLGIAALAEARSHGVDTVILQTTADTWLERFLRRTGFERAFTRTCYLLPDDVAS